MKKVVIISLSLNLILVATIIVMYNNYSFDKNHFCDNNKKGNIKKEIKDNGIIIDKTDPIYIYKSRKFPCDSGSTSYESNLCIGEKLNFADSLLNELVKNKLAILDKYIKIDEEGIVKAKDNSFFIKALKSNSFKKEKLIKTQKLWNEIRILNSKDAWLACEGATGCSGYVSKVEIEYVLERIKELKGLDVYN